MVPRRERIGVSSVRSVVSAICVYTTDVSTRCSADCHGAIRVAIASINNEPGTPEAVVVAGPHSWRDLVVRIGRVTRTRSGAAVRSRHRINVMSTDVKTHVRRIVESQIAIALAFHRMISTIAGVVIADSV